MKPHIMWLIRFHYALPLRTWEARGYPKTGYR